MKHIIFDLDGVLIDSRELHRLAFREAFLELRPDSDEDFVQLDGLSTRLKLAALRNPYRLTGEECDIIYNRKQAKTSKLLSEVEIDKELIALFHILYDDYKISVASNCVRRSIVRTLESLGILGYIDYIYSNEDVTKAKPSSEIYLKAILASGIEANDTLIVEDSYVGRISAGGTGARILGIKGRKDLSIDRIRSCFNYWRKLKWEDSTMNVLIPCAGAGSRFEKAGYAFPKPLINVQGKPMIQKVIDNLNIKAKYHFIIREEHDTKYNFSSVLKLISPECTITTVAGLTEGAAVTSLLAERYIDNDEPLLIANSDQLVDWDPGRFFDFVNLNRPDGAILTFKNTHPKWSYAEVDKNGFVIRVAEKNPISDTATVGIYYWSHGKDYVRSAKKMISDGVRTNGEFYICPSYNVAISEGLKISTFQVNSMWGIGTPEDLDHYLKSGLDL